MKTKLTALATVAMMGFTAIPAAAMESEVNMLTGTIFNSLTKMQMDDLSMVNNLTLGEVLLIESIMHGGDSEGEKRSKISNLLRKAADR